MSAATQEAIWLKQLIAEISSSDQSPVLIYDDNQLAIAMDHINIDTNNQHVSSLILVVDAGIMSRL